MFFRRRRHCGLFKLLLLLLGVKAVSRSHLSEEERHEYRAKARRFRSKLKEAYAVWDDEASDTDESTNADESTGTEESQAKD